MTWRSKGNESCRYWGGRSFDHKQQGRRLKFITSVIALVNLTFDCLLWRWQELSLASLFRNCNYLFTCIHFLNFEASGCFESPSLGHLHGCCWCFSSSYKYRSLTFHLFSSVSFHSITLLTIIKLCAINWSLPTPYLAYPMLLYRSWALALEA